MALPAEPTQQCSPCRMELWLLPLPSSSTRLTLRGRRGHTHGLSVGLLHSTAHCWRAQPCPTLSPTAAMQAALCGGGCALGDMGCQGTAGGLGMYSRCDLLEVLNHVQTPIRLISNFHALRCLHRGSAMAAQGSGLVGCTQQRNHLGLHTEHIIQLVMYVSNKTYIIS